MNRKRLLTLGLLAVFALSACTPAASAPESAPDGGMEATAVPVDNDPAPAQEGVPEAAPAATEASTGSEPAAEEPVAAPTSRGSQLAATDPSTVNLNSGEPQLIEFFAFW